MTENLEACDHFASVFVLTRSLSQEGFLNKIDVRSSNRSTPDLIRRMRGPLVKHLRASQNKCSKLCSENIPNGISNLQR